MGEDWIAKHERLYLAAIKRNLEQQLVMPPLLAYDEREVTTYHCQLLDPDRPVKVNDQLCVFLHGEGARIAVLDENRVTGYVDGESAEDLRKLLVTNNRLDCPVPVKVVTAPVGALYFEVVLSGKRKRAKES